MSGAHTFTPDLDAAGFDHLTIGRGSGMTIKEFNRGLTAYMRRKGIGKLALGGGPAKTQTDWVERGRASSKLQAPSSKLAKPVLAVDAWGQL